MRTSLLIALLTVLVGCAKAPRWHDSGIPGALITTNMLMAAGESQGITMDGRQGLFLRLPEKYWIEGEGYFRFTLSSGDAEQLLRAYRDLLHQRTASLGGAITTASDAGSRGFTYQYTWGAAVTEAQRTFLNLQFKPAPGGRQQVRGADGASDGVVSVSCFGTTNGPMQIVVFCYEHRR